MRILFISRRFFPTVSGMSVYAAGLLEYLVKRGHEVALIAQYRQDPIGRGVYGGGPPQSIQGVNVIGAESVGEMQGGDFERDVTAIVRLSESLMDGVPFDVVHAQYGYPPGLAALQIARRWGVPAIVSIQGGDGHWVGNCCSYHRRVMQTVLDHASRIIVGSKSFAQKVGANNNRDWRRFRIIPGATDTKRFLPRTALARADHDGALTFLYHGRIDRRKGVFELLDAYGILPRGRARLVVSGIGPDLDILQAECRRRGLEGVEFRGYVAYDQAPAVYRQADIFVSPTHMEGFSNTLLEAMATGLPIVSTRAVGVVDCLRDGITALLVPPQNATALAEAMQRLLDDGDLRELLAVAALRDVRTRFSWHRAGSLLEREYKDTKSTPVSGIWNLVRDPSEGCDYRKQPHLL